MDSSHEQSRCEPNTTKSTSSPTEPTALAAGCATEKRDVSTGPRLASIAQLSGIALKRGLQHSEPRSAAVTEFRVFVVPLRFTRFAWSLVDAGLSLLHELSANEGRGYDNQTVT